MRAKLKKPNNKCKYVFCQERQTPLLLFDYLCFTLIVKIFYAICKKHNHKGIRCTKKRLNCRKNLNFIILPWPKPKFSIISSSFGTPLLLFHSSSFSKAYEM